MADDDSSKISIRLKPNWDTPVGPPHLETTSYFVGRTKEIEAISNFIGRRNSSTVVITGHRGAGKTSMIRSLLKKLGDNNHPLLPVYVTGPQIVEDGGNNVSTKQFLKVISTRLFNAVETRKTKGVGADEKSLIETNYKKACAQSYLAQQASSENQKWTDKKTIESVLKVTVPDVLAAVISCVGLIQVINGNLAPYAKEVTAFLTFISPWLAVTYLRKKTTVTAQEKVESLSASELYKFDNSVSNIEFDLERIHEELFLKKVKLVYVFDELDKVSANAVTQLISKYKNFFTLGYANHVFITGDDFVGKVPSIGGKDRPIDYTLFHVHFHLSRPFIAEIEEFIGKIFENSEVGEVGLSIDDVVNFLIFESKCDYFDLIRVLQNYIGSYDEETPIIEINEIDFQDIAAKSKLQQCIKLVFEQRYQSTDKENWENNSNILYSLYEFSDEVFKRGVPNIRNLKDHHQKVEFLATRDLGVLFNRLNYVTFVNETEHSAFEEKMKITDYQRTHDFSSEVPSSLEFLSQWEVEYMTEVEEAIEAFASVFRLVNIIHKPTGFKETFDEIIDDIEGQVSIAGQSSLPLQHLPTCISVYKDLKSGAPKTYKNEEIEARSKELKTEIAKIGNTIHSILCAAFLKRVAVKPGSKNHALNQNNWQKVANDIDNDFRNRITNQRNQFVMDHKNKHGVVFVNLSQDDVFKGIKQIGNDKAKEKYRCIAIGKSGSKLISDIAVSNEFDFDGFSKTIEKIFDWYVEE